MGNGNEFGLTIAETTFEGVEVLARPQPNATIDYGSLIYITLQRSKTAREAIQTMAHLMDTHGYYSSGESFSLSDSTTGEVWIMEVIGTGPSYSRAGSVWVAQRIPDGMVCAHANQARITTFPRNDPDNCLYSPDVVDVAVQYGLYELNHNGDDSGFSFSDVYAPLTFMSARSGEARVWSIFSALADPHGDFAAEYVEYATGRDLTNRMPLWIEPFQKVTFDDVVEVLSSHFEGTELDSSIDVGSGLYGVPARPRPLNWKYKGKTYFNERTVGIPKTGWTFIAQVRPWMPSELGVVLWFAVDDSSTSPRVPIYASSREIPQAYAGVGPQDGVQSTILQWDMSKAFWVQNMVANLAYFRWSDVYPILRDKIQQVHDTFKDDLASADAQAVMLYDKKGPAAAIEFVSGFGVKAGDSLQAEWIEVYGKLFVRFRDFYTTVKDETKPDCGCTVEEVGMSDEWKKRIVDETKHRYRVKGDDDDDGDGDALGESGWRRKHGTAVSDWTDRSLY